AEVAEVQGQLLAVAHARAVVQAVGPTNPLAELEDADAFCQRVLAFALAYADLARRDWERFVGPRDQLGGVSHSAPQSSLRGSEWYGYSRGAAVPGLPRRIRCGIDFR